MRADSLFVLEGELVSQIVKEIIIKYRTYITTLERLARGIRGNKRRYIGRIT